MAPLTATAEAPSLSPTIEERAVRATLACVARHGLAKTTFDDVAREAGCARATLYRYFGGKRQLVRITVAREAARIAASVRDAGDAESTLEDAVVAMVVRAARELRDHEALQFLFAFEPELVLPHVTFDAGNRFLAGAGSASRRRSRDSSPPRAPSGPANGSRASCSRTLSHPHARSI